MRAAVASKFAVAGITALAACLDITAEPAVDGKTARIIKELRPGLASIQAPALLDRIRTLSDDRYEGRLPATPSGEAAAEWIAGQFHQIGLEPGGADGSYFQPVPLAGISSTVTATINRPAGAETLALKKDFVAWSPRTKPTVSVDHSELVFVGYGVIAPEYQWDDYKGVDLRGKTLVMLINDPPAPDPHDPSKLDPNVFRGSAMTYYGRWTYKYEIAAAKGAAGALIVHETKPAAYPWEVVVNSWGNERFDLADNADPQVTVAGWLSLEAAQRLFAAAGVDYAEAKARAVRRDFHPTPLGATIDFKVRNEIRQANSRNVIGALPGGDPKLRDEWIVYSAHWDHLGRDTRLAGDQIFNGAVDNASGCAGLLALAEAFHTQPTRPKRSVLFLATTAEEQGLLGARYYATRPVHPLAKTLADFNLDGLNTYGRTRDVSVIGFGQSTLDDRLRPLAAAQGRVLSPDSMPEKGSFYRADHFEFAKAGVPATYLKSGVNVIGKPAGWGRDQIEDFTAHRYHKVTDEIQPGWDLSGAVEDVQLLFEAGWVTANATQWPRWAHGSEFRAARERMLHAGSPDRR